MLKNQKRKIIFIVILAVAFVSLLIVLYIILILFNKSESRENNDAKVNDSEVKIGDTVVLGSYEQDNNEADGPESIEWQIIDVQDGKALIVSKSVLDCKRFNDTEDNIRWADSSLREWLNADFYDSAFLDDEKSKIIHTEVINTGTYEGYDSSCSWTITNTKSVLDTVIAESPDQEVTQDNVFLLSIDEVNHYFASEEDRKAFLSEYGVEVFINLGMEQAKSYGSMDENAILDYYEDSEEHYGRGFCNWWLRSSGLLEGCAATVDYNGTAGQAMTVNTVDGGVRPAMWIVIQ